MVHLVTERSRLWHASYFLFWFVFTLTSLASATALGLIATVPTDPPTKAIVEPADRQVTAPNPTRQPTTRN